MQPNHHNILSQKHGTESLVSTIIHSTLGSKSKPFQTKTKAKKDNNIKSNCSRTRTHRQQERKPQKSMQ